MVEQILTNLADKMLQRRQLVKSNNWQGKEGEKVMYELFNEVIRIQTGPYQSGVLDIYDDIKPYTPWAIEHMMERISGEPTNPGESYKIWPHFRKEGTDNEFRKFNGKFFGTYQERIWPKFAGKAAQFMNSTLSLENQGIWFGYGDLNDVIELLSNNHTTRQAYLPLFFPEDTGVKHGDRAFCSLGYHFIIRNGYLHMNYYMRSADLVRHFKNDIYFSVAMLYYVLAYLKTGGIQPGLLTIYVTSLHAFQEDEYQLLTKKFKSAYYDREKAIQTRSKYKNSIPHII